MVGDRKFLRVGILCGFPFPVGYAGTNRVVSLARGMAVNDADVTTYIYKPTEYPKSINNHHWKGMYFGVNFIYPVKSTIRKKNRINNHILKLWSILKTLRYIKNDNRIKPFDALIIYNDYPFLLLLFTLFLKNIKIRNVLFAVDEFPPEMRYKYNEKLSSVNEFIYSYCLKRLDGLISMTKVLITFFDGISRSKNKSVLIPMSVESDRFNSQEYKKDQSSVSYIAYIGNFDFVKDGIDILIKAFKKVLITHSEIFLYMTGEGSKEEMEKTRVLIRDNNIEERVRLLGRMHRDDVPAFLSNAQILCLSRPWTKRSAAGIPTKLGEYLCTGVPTIVTRVGELDNYLTDKVNCQIVEPDDVNVFSNRINYILGNYNESLIIAEKGRHIANTIFNNVYHGKSLLKFIKSL